MAIYTQEDYVKLGNELDLTLIGYAPANVFEKAEWRCNRCQRIMKKNRRSLIYTKNPCPCRRDDTLDESRYHKLAETLGLEWVGAHLPPNNKAETLWRVLDSEVEIAASYVQLAYGNGARFKKIIEDVKNGEFTEPISEAS